MLGLRSTWAVSGFLMLLAACNPGGSTGQGRTTSSTPGSCSPGGEVLELGRPGQDGPTATFTTDGSEFFVSARGFLHGGPGDLPTGVTLVSVGPADKPPTSDRQSAVVTNATSQVTVKEGQRTLLRLPAGSYWLWTSNTLSIALEACRPGAITAVRPVP